MSGRMEPERGARPLPAARMWLAFVAAVEVVWLAFLVWMVWRS